MGKLVGALITIGIIGVVAGGVLVGVGYATTKDEAESTLEKKEYQLEDSFENFEIDLVSSNLLIKKAEDGVNKVVCQEREKVESVVKVEGNTLSIVQRDERPWYKKWFFNWGWITGQEMKVTVYLTGEAYNNFTVENSVGTIKVESGFTFNTVKAVTHTGSVTFSSSGTESMYLETDTGSVNVNDITTKELTAKSDTGSVNASKVVVTGNVKVENHTGSANFKDSSCENMDVTTNTGSVNISNTVATGYMNIKTSTGSINFDSADADTLDLESSTGSIKGSLLTGKTFQANSSTGSVKVPNTTGGLCRAKTSTGSIKLTVVGQ